MLLRILAGVVAVIAGACSALMVWLGCRRRVVVLCYHTVSRDLPGEMSPEIFERQICLMLSKGYKFVSADEYADWLDGKIKLPRKAALLTFDDGFRSQLNVMAFLKRYNIPAINFIVPQRIGGCYDWDGVPVALHEPLMNEREIKLWLQSGFNIGSHTLGHVHLDKLDDAEARRQIWESRNQLVEKFAVKCDWLCYPYGDFDFATKKMAKECGYKGAFACYNRTHPWRLERYALRRVLVYPVWSDRKFLYKISWRFDLLALLNLTLKRVRKCGK